MCYAAAAESLQLCPTPCDPRDGSPPGSPIPGILQARTREWVAISFSCAWKWKVKGKSLSRVWFPATPWTAAYQALPSMGFPRWECCSGVPSPFLPSVLQAFLLSLLSGKSLSSLETSGLTWKWCRTWKQAKDVPTVAHWGPRERKWSGSCSLSVRQAGVLRRTSF